MYCNVRMCFYLQISMIHDNVNMKPRGYAFIEYEHERDMHGESDNCM